MAATIPPTVEFDPWLQYSKFNDMYTSSLSGGQVSSASGEGDESGIDVGGASRGDDETTANTFSDPLSSVDVKQSFGLNGAASNQNQKRHGKLEG